MPKLRLDDGVVLNLPDDATPQEIAQLVADHYGVEKPQEGLEDPEADLAETAPTPSSGLPASPDMPSDPSPDPASAETRPPRVRIEAYQNDPNDPGNLRYPHPVDYPTGVDPANPFKDNFHWNWRRR